MVEPTQILEELAALLEKYQATISYSNDEGINISVDGVCLFTGFLSDSAAPLILRAAKYHKDLNKTLEEIYLKPIDNPDLCPLWNGGEL